MQLRDCVLHEPKLAISNCFQSTLLLASRVCLQAAHWSSFAVSISVELLLCLIIMPLTSMAPYESHTGAKYFSVGGSDFARTS